MTKSIQTVGASDIRHAELNLLDQLRDEGRISAGLYEAIYKQAKRAGESIVELLIEHSNIEEKELLKRLADVYGTRFVTTERLARAHIDQAALSKVPRRICELHQCFPVLFEPQRDLLAVVSVEPTEALVKEIQRASGVRTIQAHLARPKAIAAAIRKYYANDPTAFASILPLSSTSKIRAAALPEVTPRASTTEGIQLDIDWQPQFTAKTTGSHGGAFLSARPQASAPIQKDAASQASIEASGLLEIVRALVGLLEESHPYLHNHSSHVAAVTEKMCEKLGLSHSEKQSLVLAALLHDVGKGKEHLTALSVARSESHRAQAQRCYAIPIHRFAAANLPEITFQAIESMYERWDGQGLPRRLSQNQIPLGARILAIADTYSDLVTHPHNPYRRLLSPSEAIDVIEQLSGSIFDPGLIGALRKSAGALSTDGANQENKTHVLILDASMEFAQSLATRFKERGFEVRWVNSLFQAERLWGVINHRIQVIIVDPDTDNGRAWQWIARLQQETALRDRVLVVTSHRSDSFSIARSYELGAADYVVKPVAPDVIVAKAVVAFERVRQKNEKRGFTGNLKEMGLAEVLQALAHGRKSGLLTIQGNNMDGQISLHQGEVVEASYGPLDGEEAIYAMLKIKEGSFHFEAGLPQRIGPLRLSVESLLLEGMRRLDEGESRF
ncbi:MAG: DUF4388 domain-containing protein [Sandaracinaceae bacterium]|nr:DUF4388 domain-containing protein [Sandaracinaceae bacterium]